MPLLEDFQRAVEAARSEGRDIHVLSGASARDISEAEGRCNGQLSTELRALLEYTTGFRAAGIGTVDLLGRAPFEFEALRNALPIASDGSGNFWIMLARREGDEPVLFVAHDPAAVLIASPSLSDFLRQALMGVALLNDHLRDARRIARKNPFAVTKEAAGRASDADLKRFAAELPSGALVTDLRSRTPGEGFAWGVAGPRTQVWSSADDSLLFATEARSRGFLGSLLRG